MLHVAIKWNLFTGRQHKNNSTVRNHKGKRSDELGCHMTASAPPCRCELAWTATAQNFTLFGIRNVAGIS